MARLTVKKLYEELRRAEWDGKTLSEFITKLENDHPDLRETDEQLRTGRLIGLRVRQTKADLAKLRP